jgi:hypothetical protein
MSLALLLRIGPHSMMPAVDCPMSIVRSERFVVLTTNR